MEKIEILGVEIDKTDYDSAVAWIREKIMGKKRVWIATPNPEIVLKAVKEKSFREIINSADLKIADGIGLSIAAWYKEKLQDWQIPGLLGRIWLWKLAIWNCLGKKSGLKRLPRVSGDVLVIKLLEIAHKRKWKFFLLGGAKGNAANAAEEIKEKFGVEAMGHKGAEDIRFYNEQENLEVIRSINFFQPEILLVAYGAPWQEKWISENLKKIKINVAIGVGGTIDDLAEGNETPHWIREKGLRWLWRLWKDPRRIRRIWNAVVVFGWQVIRS